MPWTMDILGNTGTTLVTDANFRTARITWAADAVGAAEVALRDADVSSGNFRAGQKRIAFRTSGGTRIFQGWLDRFERSGPPSDIRYRATARGLRSILERRVVHGDFSNVATVATTIGWNLINHAQGQTDGGHGFTLGTVTGTAPSRTRYFCDGDVIEDAISELAEFNTGGFAWEIDADGKYNAWVNGRGTDVSGSVTIAPADTIEWTLIEDVSEYATYVTGLGDRNDEQPCGPPLAIVSDASKSTYGRREVVIEADTLDSTEMTDKANEELRARVSSRLKLTTSWVEGQGPWAFGTRWIGDTVTAALGTAFGGNATMRCTEITITLESTKEFVQMGWEKA